MAAVRRQSRLSSLAAQQASASVSSSAEAAQSSLSEALFNAWSDSELKKFLDEHDINVPQGSKRNELIALARKNRKYLVDEAHSLSASATSAYGAATSKAGNEWARATDDAQLKAEDAFDAVVAEWSNSRLKAYLDARGIPVPQSSKRNELLSKVRLHKHKAVTGYSAWTFDTWTTENLQYVANLYYSITILTSLQKISRFCQQQSCEEGRRVPSRTSQARPRAIRQGIQRWR